MDYGKAKDNLIKFIDEKFTPNLSDDIAITFVDGNYGVGKTHLALELVEKYKNKDKKSVKFKKFIYNLFHFKKKIFDKKVCYYSLAGKANMEEVIDDLDKVLTKTYYFRKILSKLKLSVGYSGFCGLETDFEHKTKKIVKWNSQEIVLIIDELDRKCDLLDLNGLFGVITNIFRLAKVKVSFKVILIGNLDGLNDRDLKNAMSFKDKICSNTIAITKANELSGINLFKDFNFDNKIFPYIKQIKNNIRVCYKATRIYNQINTTDFSKETKLGVLYFLLCYFYNIETSFFNDKADKDLANHKALKSHKYEGLLYSYMQRQDYFDEFGKLAWCLIKDGTFNRHQTSQMLSLVELTKGDIEALPKDFRFNSINETDYSLFKDLIFAINGEYSNVSKIISGVKYCNEHICDVFFMAYATHISSLHPFLKKYKFPKDYLGIVEQNNFDANLVCVLE